MRESKSKSEREPRKREIIESFWEKKTKATGHGSFARVFQLNKSLVTSDQIQRRRGASLGCIFFGETTVRFLL